MRLRVVDLLYEAASWADVVRESQEAVELALKGLLRAHGIEAPRTHDVSAVLLAETKRLPPSIQACVERLAAVSRDLRRDRELAFYGAEDLLPSEFYGEKEARHALDGVRFVVETVAPEVIGGT